MVNSPVSWFLVLAALCLLCEAVESFVYESAEYDEETMPKSEKHYGGETTGLPIVESDVNKEKKFALAVFFKTNWFRAAQYCRYRGMQLASVVTAKEEKLLEYQMERVGFELGPTWTSGTDLSEEGVYFWASTGTPVTFTKWGAGQPGGDKQENCLYINNNPSEGFAWHDGDCASENYFACEFFTSNLTAEHTPLYV